jgi:hypothetical protein
MYCVSGKKNFRNFDRKRIAPATAPISKKILNAITDKTPSLRERVHNRWRPQLLKDNAKSPESNNQSEMAKTLLKEIRARLTTLLSCFRKYIRHGVL